MRFALNATYPCTFQPHTWCTQTPIAHLRHPLYAIPRQRNGHWRGRLAVQHICCSGPNRICLGLARADACSDGGDGAAAVAMQRWCEQEMGGL